MAGSLIKIDEEIVTSAVASVSLLGIDTTYDVYKVVWTNVLPSNNSVALWFRLKNASGDVTSSDYDYARKLLRSSSSFGNDSTTNIGAFRSFTLGTGTSSQEKSNGFSYCFNFSNSSEFSFITQEEVVIDDVGETSGIAGGGVLTVAELHTGLTFFFGSAGSPSISGNIASGTFSLYAIKK